MDVWNIGVHGRCMVKSECHNEAFLYFLASSIELAVPRDLPSQKATNLVQASTISSLRIIPACVPMLQSGINSITGIPREWAQSRARVSAPRAPPEIMFLMGLVL